MRISNLITRTVAQDEAKYRSMFPPVSSIDHSEPIPEPVPVPEYIVDDIKGRYTTNETSLLLTKGLFAICDSPGLADNLLQWAENIKRIDPATTHPFIASGAYDWLFSLRQKEGQARIGRVIAHYGFK